MPIGEWLSYIRFEPLTHIFRAITFLGNEEFIYLFLPILYWCWQKRKGVELIVLVIIAAHLNFLIKGALAWERPPTELWLINARGYTFPSGHAVLSTAIWGFLAYEIRKRWFTVFAFGIIFLVSLSRIYLGVHYPQDVLAGIAFGAVYLHLLRFGWHRLERSFSKINDAWKAAFSIAVCIVIAYLQPTTDVGVAMGILAGTVSGYLLEPHVADFEPRDRWYRNIAKSLVGIAVLLIVWRGLEWSLPINAGFKWFESFIIGIWITAGAPWIFVQVKIAGREL